MSRGSETIFFLKQALLDATYKKYFLQIHVDASMAASDFTPISLGLALFCKVRKSATSADFE